MVYFPKNHSRTPAQKLVRKLIGVAAVALIIFAFWNMPYDILREERFRLYGETRTTGLVTEVRTEASQGDSRTYFIDYKYIDRDGFAREAEASLPKSVWDKFHPGTRLDVLYVTGRPALSRVHGEIEPKFQIWLRSLLD